MSFRGTRRVPWIQMNSVWPRLLGRGVMWKIIWSNNRYVHLGQSFLILLQRSTTLNHNSNWMELKRNSSALLEVRWLAWAYHLSPPVIMKRDNCPQRVAHSMVRYPSNLAVVSQDPPVDCCSGWSEYHLQRNGESRTYLLLRPESLVYFLLWNSKDLCNMSASCLVRLWQDKKESVTWLSLGVLFGNSASVSLWMLLQVILFSVWYWYLWRQEAVQKGWSQHCCEIC